MTVIGKQGAVAATSLAVRSAGSAVTQQPSMQTQSLSKASIDCTGPQLLLSGGELFSDLSSTFTGINKKHQQGMRFGWAMASWPSIVVLSWNQKCCA